MFSLSYEKIDTATEINPRSGARVVFEGIVRNHNEGSNVTSLEYSAYDEMAIKEGQKIVDEALSKFDVISGKCVHRLGHLQITDMAVWVEVYSEHRREAFEACQYIIDEVKLRVPVWKKEHYVDKEPEWVACHRCQEAHSSKDHNHHHDHHSHCHK